MFVCEANLRGADLGGANLSYVSLVDADITNADPYRLPHLRRIRMGTKAKR